VAFISAVARALPPADAYAQLAAMVAGRLQQQPLLLTGKHDRRYGYHQLTLVFSEHPSLSVLVILPVCLILPVLRSLWYVAPLLMSW